MSQEDIDLVRSILAAWEQADFDSTEWADPDIEFVFADGPEPRSTKGFAAMAAGWREFLGAWVGYRVRGEEYGILGTGVCWCSCGRTATAR